MRRRAEQDRWAAHPWLAFGVRVLVLVVPVAVGLLVAFALTSWLPSAGSLGGQVLWWTTVLVGSTLALVGTDQLARRALPLAVLLELSLVFPDHAPSRLRASRTASTGDLERRLLELRKRGVDSPAVETAETLVTLVGILGVHDKRTRGHSERVRAVTDLLTEELGLPEEDRGKLRWAALVHDLGKLTVPVGVLNGGRHLHEEDWEMLRRHPEEGERLAAGFLPWLGEWGGAVVEHHERWDGGGYPHGLAGEQIGLGARIVAVADSFEVMTAHRSYAPARSASAARKELARCAGGQFDPAVVRAFLGIAVGRLWWVLGPVTWAATVPVTSAVEGAGQAVKVAASGALITAVIAGGVLTGPAGQADGPGASLPPVAAAAPVVPTSPVPDRPAQPPSADSGEASSPFVPGPTGSGSASDPARSGDAASSPTAVRTPSAGSDAAAARRSAPAAQPGPTEPASARDPAAGDADAARVRVRLPATDQPAANGPATVRPPAVQPPAVQPPAVQPSPDDPDAEDPDSDNPDSDDPSTEDPSTEDPSTDDPSTDDPSTDDPDAEDPDADDPGTGDPGTGDPDTGDPDTDEPDSDGNSDDGESAAPRPTAYYLAAPADGGDRHRLTTAAPQESGPAPDTDGDDAPGRTLVPTRDGLDEPPGASRLDLDLPVDRPLTLTGRPRLDLFAELARDRPQGAGRVDVTAALFDCVADRCTRLASGELFEPGQDEGGMQLRRLVLSQIDTVVQQGHVLRLSLIADRRTDGRLLVGFASESVPSRLVLPVDRSD